MDGGAWWATVHGVAKSRTRLSDFTPNIPLRLKLLKTTWPIFCWEDSLFPGCFLWHKQSQSTSSDIHVCTFDYLVQIRRCGPKLTHLNFDPRFQIGILESVFIRLTGFKSDDTLTNWVRESYLKHHGGRRGAEEWDRKLLLNLSNLFLI